MPVVIIDRSSLSTCSPTASCRTVYLGTGTQNFRNRLDRNLRNSREIVSPPEKKKKEMRKRKKKGVGSRGPLCKQHETHFLPSIPAFRVHLVASSLIVPCIVIIIYLFLLMNNSFKTNNRLK